jgi:hypothetical protein
MKIEVKVGTRASLCPECFGDDIENDFKPVKALMIDGRMQCSWGVDVKDSTVQQEIAVQGFRLGQENVRKQMRDILEVRK